MSFPRRYRRQPGHKELDYRTGVLSGRGKTVRASKHAIAIGGLNYLFIAQTDVLSLSACSVSRKYLE